MDDNLKDSIWICQLLNEAKINLEPQQNIIKEINKFVESVLINNNFKISIPQYIGIVDGKDLIIIDYRSSLTKHEKLNNGIISEDFADILDYAVNSALFFARHLFDKFNYNKIIAVGISGNKKIHRITPIIVDSLVGYTELPDIKSFANINFDKLAIEKDAKEILRDAAALNEDLRNYCNLKDSDKLIVVSGILLALDEIKNKNSSIKEIINNNEKTDGEKIYEIISYKIDRMNISHNCKNSKILNQFSIIKDTSKLNEINKSLGKTPLGHFTEFLYNKFYKYIMHSTSSEDYLGRFYEEFMSYSCGDGQTLGIVLTPKHITELCCDLLNINDNDIIIDPCCGTASFLIAAMHRLSSKTNCSCRQLHGFEIQPYMFLVAITNMILRGSGKINIINSDFLEEDIEKLRINNYTVGMMNPPYAQGSKKNPNLYEMSFVKHLLDCLSDGGRCAVVVPQSSMTGKTLEEKRIKSEILKNHTLEGVITLNKNTFYGVGTMPCIAVFTAHKPHKKDYICKFINFEDDGFKIAPHIGLIETESVQEKKKHLLDVWFNKIDGGNKFCIKTPINDSDSWLHSFYYFNEEIPTEEDFNKIINDYLSFEFLMVMQGKEYLFQEGAKDEAKR